MTDKEERQPWHYNVFEGKPAWAVEMSRQRVIQQQHENVTAKADRRRNDPA